MLSRIKDFLIQFGFYLIASFAAATAGYFILKTIRHGDDVFGSLYRMSFYHERNPIAYILIPCVVYSIIVAVGGSQAIYKSVFRQILLTLAIIFFTVLFSLPFGGMLYYYHDMQAGYFPDNWLPIIMSEGAAKGFDGGWLLIGLSFPYNVLGIVVCYFITKVGSRIFSKKKAANSL